MAVSRLEWYLGRLTAMQPAEIAWRSLRACENLLRPVEGLWQTKITVLDRDGDVEKLFESFRNGVGRPVLLDGDRAQLIAAENPSQAQGLTAVAQRLLAGERSYFGYPTVDVGRDIDWHRDAVSDYRWPAIRSNRINHRVALSDPKWIWELNRLQHLPVLAEAWLFTDEAVFAETAFEHLDTWLEQNPIGTGIAWRGAFEAGIRAISVAVALQGLRTAPALTAQRFRRIAGLLDASAHYCWRERSLFSSANNHLVGELTGVVVTHLLFPELPTPKALYPRAFAALLAEAERQILPDGAGAEQSVSYQMFTAELLALTAALLRLRGDQPPARLLAALHRSAEYLAAVVGSVDPDPRYGDDDEGFALRLGAESRRTVREHLGIIAAATGSSAAAGMGAPSLTATWFGTALGNGSADTTTPERPLSAPSAYAPDGGLVILRDGRRRVTADVGPLGYLSIAAHGHADALAVTLSADGRDLIVDPGTGSYYGHPHWRSAHRGTRAHGTVCIDDVDQSVDGGPFYWRRHANTTVRTVDLKRGIVDAEHDGYRRLKDPAVHRRWLSAPPDDPTMVVVDLITGRSEHDIDVSWPLHPELDATATQNGHQVTRDGSPVLQLCYAATSSIEFTALRGDPESNLGWWSGRLEERVPAWLLGVHCRSVTPVAILTILSTDIAVTVSDPEISHSGTTLEVGWSVNGARRALTIDTNHPGAIQSAQSPGMKLVTV